MMESFPTDYQSVLAAIDAIDPVAYSRNRNYLNGAVTKLSPYISRGVISTRVVLESVMEKGYSFYKIETFVKELCWRDYFQRVAQVKNPDFDIRQEQTPVLHYQIPQNILIAQTGIEAIDTSIQDLYETGYMHNHCRMYLAFLCCNLGQSHWLMPAKWLYYHLLDGDWASNACSWQWVAGANSSKKYYANQDNINTYTRHIQKGTFIDFDYETIMKMDVPEVFSNIIEPVLKTTLPDSSMKSWNDQWPAFVYNYYNLDPNWHHGEVGNRVLLLDPNIFSKYPVSQNCIEFMLALTTNIPAMQIFIGTFNELKSQYPSTAYYYKEHPLNVDYVGIEESRDWIVPTLSGYYPSFFSYWKKAEGQIVKDWPTNQKA